MPELENRDAGGSAAVAPSCYSGVAVYHHRPAWLREQIAVFEADVPPRRIGNCQPFDWMHELSNSRQQVVRLRSGRWSYPEHYVVVTCKKDGGDGGE
jgi:hypothetical protein